MRPLVHLLAVSITIAAFAPKIAAQHREDDTVEASAQVLREILAIPGRGIPESLLKDAHGIAIIPGMIKGGFVVGVKHGEGVIVTRDDNGAWRAPAFLTATGGSIGWQAGVQSSDVVLVFRTRTSINSLMRGKFTIGADAGVAAGPVGREASAATDSQLRAEILSYSRSRGLFAGLAIDGAVLQVDNRAGAAYYAPRPGMVPGQIPASAVKLVEQVAAATGNRIVVVAPAAVPSAAPTITPVPTVTLPERELVRRQLVDASSRMFAVVDAQWRQYLALPGEVFAEAAPNPAASEQLRQCLNRYAAIATDPRYRALTERREFHDTYLLLQRFASSPAANGVVSLPPPPPR
jgi:lipid-binding SYLF domain-containing protein